MFKKCFLPGWLVLLFGLGLLGLVSGCATNPPSYVYVPPPQLDLTQSREMPERRISNAPEAVAPEVDQLQEDQPPRRFFWQRQARSEVAVDEPVTADTVTPPAPAEQQIEEAPSSTRRFLFSRKSGQTEPPSAAVEPLEELQRAAPVAIPPPDTSIYRLRPNDAIIVHLRGIPEPANLEMLVDDQGFINLPFIQSILAAGKTASELQRAIESAYVDGEIYQRITVNIILPTQSYFVRGEVRAPGRFPLTPGMTILKAIAAAGGYTEYANPRRVNILRGGTSITVNAREAERGIGGMNINVEDGDVIVVPRSIF